MTCKTPCVDCDCGQAMNNITPDLQVRANVATDDDLRALVRVAKGKPACIDCGGNHLPAPCVECVNCSRAFYLATMHIDAEKQWWCESCFSDSMREDLTPSEQAEFDFGHLVNE